MFFSFRISTTLPISKYLTVVSFIWLSNLSGMGICQSKNLYRVKLAHNDSSHTCCLNFAIFHFLFDCCYPANIISKIVLLSLFFWASYVHAWKYLPFAPILLPYFVWELGSVSEQQKFIDPSLYEWVSMIVERVIEQSLSWLVCLSCPRWLMPEFAFFYQL